MDFLVVAELMVAETEAEELALILRPGLPIEVAVEVVATRPDLIPLLVALELS
jgi:hypothetical protein